MKVLTAAKVMEEKGMNVCKRFSEAIIGLCPVKLFSPQELEEIE